MYLQARFKYSTKIKVDREDWDLKIQRPKARRGTVGEAKQSEEEIIFETQNHIKRLIEQLGQKDESQA